MGRITILDQNMINMIAAGEVIERPASVVKELMENSIDSGATKITVTIEDGGRKLISVTDNGCGMDAEDLAVAFQSHATSKIKASSDLQAISTMGFRGEALASIASVAQVKATSRTNDSDGGNCIEIDCGYKTKFAPCSADYGTTIQIRDLFYKLPARRKFLKTANTEAGHITELFTQLALANTQLDMILISNGRQLYRLTANQKIRQRIEKLFSSRISENLIETQSNEKGLNIFALLGRPDISKTNRKFQYVFLNSRYIRDKFISHAIKEAYRGSLESNRFPVAFLFIQMPFEDMDVNVHPTKIEVRFYNANLVHSQILAVLREKLSTTNLDITAKLSAAENRSEEISKAMADFFKKHRPSHAQQQFNFRSKTISAANNLTYDNTNFQANSPKTMSQSTCDKTGEPTLNAIQIHNSFIVVEEEDGFSIIDQHALHERIMYETLQTRISTGKLESQKLLIPESFDLDASEAEAVKSNYQLFEKLGIELVPFGPNTMALQAFPTLLSKIGATDFVHDLVNLLSDKTAAFDSQGLFDEVLNMAACKAAIKAGQKLSPSEMAQLLADREIAESPSRCPHGRPATIKFPLNQLEKQFNRT